MRVKNFFTIFGMLATVSANVFAAQAPNPRGGGAQTDGGTAVVSPRESGREVKRAAGVASSSSGTTVTRAATRRPTATASRAATGVRSVTAPRSARTATRQNVVLTNNARPQTSAARAAALTGAVRSAVSNSADARNARSGTRTVSAAGASRAATSRATAVFNDISKIGGGYAQCREAYATCMDQLCANANDTYRRCFCSARFTDFQDTEWALDQAKTLLAQFEDNNLAAVNMTAAEVDAMYSATVGEQAIKDDTSAAAATLAEIGDLLSGKKKRGDATSNSSSGSLGVLSLDFSTDVDDIWGGGDSIFGGDNDVDLAALQGQELYSQANKQCLELVTSACENEAVLNMARSSYNILITQDCNAYEKRLDSQREAVMQTVRQAEQYLREARLEEYRAHNSADVNQCLDNVRSALLQDTACGANYKRCLDYSGVYINQSTGEPIYSPRLFELQNLIRLSGVGSADVLEDNTGFNNFLDSRKMFAASALDSCRDIADTVWTEFKRAALIEISQAQDEKIEEVKASCVQTMADCYDTQTEGLKNFDTTTAQSSGAVAASAARAMCEDKVIACASLYGDAEDCTFDGNGKLSSGDNSGRCGLDQLLAFVDSVDSAKISEGCATAMQNYAQELCAPAAGDAGHVWPYGCRLRSGKNIELQLQKYAVQTCPSLDGTKAKVDDEKGTVSGFGPEATQIIENTMRQIQTELGMQLRAECTKASADGSGVWDTTGYTAYNNNNTNEINVHKQWLTNVFGGPDLNKLADTGIVGYDLAIEDGNGGFLHKVTQPAGKSGTSGTSGTSGESDNGTEPSMGWGVCVTRTLRQVCESQNSLPGMGDGFAKYDEKTKTCDLSSDWYQAKCKQIDGFWDSETETCYIKPAQE